MNPDRVILDIQGTQFTFPINPIEYVWNYGDKYVMEETIQDSPLKFISFFDSRERTMTWSHIPNKTPYFTFPNALLNAVGISGVRINHRDLNLGGDLDSWRSIRIDHVSITPLRGQKTNRSYLSFDMVMRFSYI